MQMKESTGGSKNGVHFTIHISEETSRILSSIITLTNRNPKREQSAAIEEAIKFYFAYLSGQLSMDYVCGVYGKQMDAIVNSAASRLSSLLFKQAVEINLLTRIAALDYDVSKDEYDKMRSKAVEAVKRSNGRIALLDTINEHDGIV